MLKEGKQLAIIEAVTLKDGWGRMEGCTVCELSMICTKGEQRGLKFNKRFYYKTDLPDMMKKEFLQLGFCIKSPCDIPNIQNELVGKIALLSVAFIDDCLHCNIVGYMGSDDPAKYI